MSIRPGSTAANVVGLTSGASAPEWLVDRMLAFLESQGFDDVEVVTLAEERVRFSLAVRAGHCA